MRRPLSYTLAVLATATAAVAVTATAASAAPTGVYFVSASSTVQPGRIGAATAACTQGAPLGGGLMRPGELIVRESRPTAEGGWTVVALNPASTPQPIIAFAVCGRVEFQGRRSTTTDVVVQPHSTATAVATCPSGYRLTGGGFMIDRYPQQAGIPEDMLASVIPYVSLPDATNNSWTVRVLNLAAGTRMARSFAICATHTSVSTTLSMAMLSPGQGTSLDTICPAGTVATGAGWGYGGTGVRQERVLVPRGTTAAPTVPRGWTAQFVNAHQTSTVQVVTAAVCIPAA